MNINKLVGAAAVIAAVSLASPSAYALTAAQATAVKKAVTAVAAPEMPAKAAELVKAASKEDREAVAVTAVRAAIYKNRSTAAAVVAAVAKAAPDLAPAITLAATQMESQQANAITIAAVAAAPMAKVEINTSAARGVRETISPISAVPPAFTPTVLPQAPQTPGKTTPGGFEFERPMASGPVIVNVTQSNQPINPTTGGNGDGTFTGGTANPTGTSTPVDYTAPRSF